MNTDNRREVVQFKEWLNSGERVGKAYKTGKIDKKIKNRQKKAAAGAAAFCMGVET